MKIEVLKNENNHRELLPQIVDRIFAVCRNDPNFELKDEMEIVENKMEALRQKIQKQVELLQKSNLRTIYYIHHKVYIKSENG